MFQRRIEDEVAVDFVGAEDKIVAHAEIGEAHEFLAAPDAGDRIVGIAEIKEFRAWGDGAFEGVPINGPGSGLKFEGYVHGSARGIFRRGNERRVDGRERQDFVAGFGEGLSGDVEGDDETGEPDDPGAFDFPTVVALHGGHDGVDGGLYGPRVAEEAVVDALVKGGEDGGGALEIHIGDPHGQNIAAGVFLPFLGVAVGARDGGIEVEGHAKNRRRHHDRRGVATKIPG